MRMKIWDASKGRGMGHDAIFFVTRYNIIGVGEDITAGHSIDKFKDITSYPRITVHGIFSTIESVDAATLTCE